MIEVKLEDFEDYRGELLRYASGLLRVKGFGNNKVEELDQVAKDIVQNAYLSFHDCNKGVFVNKFHLEAFLKIILYRKYLDNFIMKNKDAQFTQLKKEKTDLSNLEETFHPTTELDFDSIDTLSLLSTNVEFRNTLGKQQLIILDKLLAGSTQVEIVKELSVSKQCIWEAVKNIRLKYYKFVE